MWRSRNWETLTLNWSPTSTPASSSISAFSSSISLFSLRVFFIAAFLTKLNLLPLLLFRREDNELDFDALEHLENPDFHVESVRAVKLFNKIKEVLTDIECPRKFTLADLLMPDPYRTDLFLGAILNYLLDRSVS